jgi:hypothetical protein
MVFHAPAGSREVKNHWPVFDPSSVMLTDSATKKGDGANLCEAPSGPFRQISPVPFFVANNTTLVYAGAFLGLAVLWSYLFKVLR